MTIAAYQGSHFLFSTKVSGSSLAQHGLSPFSHSPYYNISSREYGNEKSEALGQSSVTLELDVPFSAFPIMNSLPWDRKAKDLADVAGTRSPQVCGNNTSLSATEWASGLEADPDAGSSPAARGRKRPRAWATLPVGLGERGPFHPKPSAPPPFTPC